MSVCCNYSDSKQTFITVAHYARGVRDGGGASAERASTLRPLPTPLQVAHRAQARCMGCEYRSCALGGTSVATSRTRQTLGVSAGAPAPAPLRLGSWMSIVADLRQRVTGNPVVPA